MLQAAAQSPVLRHGLWRCIPALGRSLASKPEPAMSVSTTEEVDMCDLPGSLEQATLVTLPRRPFGALSDLPQAVASRLAGGVGCVGVLREPFAPFDAACTPLSDLVRPLAPGSVAISSAITAQASSAVVVDEYAPDGSGRYVLARAARALPEFLASQRLRVALVPNVQTAVPACDVGAVTFPNSIAAARGGAAQSTNRVLMVSPTAFGFNEQAAQDNSFMHAAEQAGRGSALTRTVLDEYAGLQGALGRAGVEVALFEHDISHGTPDAVFPNNWFSTHAANEGRGPVNERTLVLYPMKCPNRAAERRPDIIAAAQRLGNYTRVVDMSVEEANHCYFEGTGVLVLDRVNSVAYVNLSERADLNLAQAWVSSLGYKELVAFHSFDQRGKAVYHTNVMMAIGSDVAIVCADSVQNAKERQHLLSKLQSTHNVVQISHEQMDALCGNVLEVLDGCGLPVLAMSTRAHNAFTVDQRRAMLRHVAALVHAPVNTLEDVGGGGVRCCIAELF